MSDVRFELRGAREFVAYFASLPRKVQARVREVIVDLSNQLRNIIFGDTLTTILNVRTGNLRNKLHVLDIEETATSVRGGVGDNAIYAQIQELGGTISAKNVANLTIPLDAVLTPAGVARYSAHDVISDPSIGGYTGTFFRNGILFGVQGGNPATVDPLFVLRPSVTLPARPWMATGLEQIREQAEAELRVAVAGEL